MKKRKPLDYPKKLKKPLKNQLDKPSLWGLPQATGLYDPESEKDSCGVGFVAREDGTPSHGILQDALRALTKLSHRGAVDADEQTGDGAGILSQIPQGFFKREIKKFGEQNYAPGDFAVASVFFPRQDSEKRERARRIIEHVLQDYGLELIGWRHVPVDLEVLGEKARHFCPDIKHLLVGRAPISSHETFVKNIFLARKEAERRFKVSGLNDIYFPSFSHQTIVYKGLLMAAQVARFFIDLKDECFETAGAVFHQRYSTNTFPTWALAHPFRFLAHNGEINTLQGNRNWMRARIASQKLPRWRGKSMIFDSVIQEGGSDSMSLDNVAESLVVAGRDINHAMMMLLPEPWQHSTDEKNAARDFYEFHSCLNEAWDGPAAVIYCDGRYIGGIMDRNGLRPMRFKRHEDGRIVCASELGVLEWNDEEVIEKGRVGPGRMLVLDLKAGKLMRNLEVKGRYFRLQPYGEWLKKHMVFLGGRDSWPVSGATRTAGLSEKPPHYLEVKPLLSKSADPVLDLRRQQIVFGFTKEEIDLVIKPMALEAKEPLGSMGDDTPLAVLSQRPQHLSRFFKQRFAQVTNPPIDSIREAKMMTLNTYIGERGNIFTEHESHAHLLRVPTSMFGENDLAELLKMRDLAFKPVRLRAVFRVNGGTAALEAALARLMRQAHRAVSKGAKVLVISDRGVSEKFAPIPMLLAVSSVHHHLIRTGLRLSASILCETGDAWEVHHVATLIGYGASVVIPYLALHTIKQLSDDGAIEGKNWTLACARFHYAIDTGILKVMSKMGISTLASYRGAQVFDAVGLNQGLIEGYFPGTISKIGGVGLEHIAGDVLARHKMAFGLSNVENIFQLPAGGNYRYRRGEEQHAFDPGLVKLIHQACEKNDGEAYQEFVRQVHGRPPLAVRDLLQIPAQFSKVQSALETIEPWESIAKRFGTSAMSVGALSKESHEQLAVVMNRLGGRSNSGEGGEDPARFVSQGDQTDWANSSTKQVASGRFGVTPEYLLSAREIQIKMAQGSKPGEGGQLPGHKVSAFIAQLRFSNPGVPLISPPPHHDIYSIEDLAQLIFDLRQVNPKAKISVKLVSLYGVGTIASGVAKANADIIQISGHDGGTGASPLSSIKNAGLPWEIGLAEAHQTLILNNLRHRVILRCDGGLKTGLDVIKAGILGAQEFDFGSMALVSQGCVMVRNCHLNTCPTGIATQDETLRKKFAGTPEKTLNYFRFVANEIRQYLALLGLETFESLVGRTDLLEQIPQLDSSPERKKFSGIDLAPLLQKVTPLFQLPPSSDSVKSESKTLHETILLKCKPAIERGESVSMTSIIRNEHRTMGARLSGEIVQRHGASGLKEDCIVINFKGSAGQSFGAFLCPGLRLVLEGEANDYVGKGMAGGVVAIRPSAKAKFQDGSIVGNTVLYGATGGEVFIAGKAGERFAVRNSGAVAVVEGAGHHACEYMTRGKVAILGRVSGNLGAGMSGGLAYVYDEDDALEEAHNPQMVKIKRLSDPSAISELKSLIERHVHFTHSAKGKNILSAWAMHLPKFFIVEPKSVAEINQALIPMTLNVKVS